jgi:hypothetical protein
MVEKESKAELFELLGFLTLKEISNLSSIYQGFNRRPLTEFLERRIAKKKRKKKVEGEQKKEVPKVVDTDSKGGGAFILRERLKLRLSNRMLSCLDSLSSYRKNSSFKAGIREKVRLGSGLLVDQRAP